MRPRSSPAGFISESIGEQPGGSDGTWRSTLSGGALNLPNLETSDCPLPNLQFLYVDLVSRSSFSLSHSLYDEVVLTRSIGHAHS
jgi:hypothetical protein